MRTTLNIDDELYRRVKAAAALRGCSVTAVVEDSLRLALRLPDNSLLAPMPTSTRQPGFAARFAAEGIALNDTSAVLDEVDR